MDKRKAERAEGKTRKGREGGKGMGSDGKKIGREREEGGKRKV